MSKAKKKEPIFEAVIYFKNNRGATTVGAMTENETQIIFKSNGFTSVIEKKILAALVVDNGKKEMKEKEGKPISGFEIYTESGAALGFNGWKISERIYVTNQVEIVEFYEPIIYIKTGPEDPGKNPPVKEEKEKKIVAQEKLSCVRCHKEVKESDFRDQLSLKEFEISRLCQKCQDIIADEDEDEQEDKDIGKKD